MDFWHCCLFVCGIWVRISNTLVVTDSTSYFYLPETKGRALEELNACFEERLSARSFDKFIATGAAGRVAAYEAATGFNADDMEAQRKGDAMHFNDEAQDHKTHEVELVEVAAAASLE